MDTRYGANPNDAAAYGTRALRDEFLVSGIFASGEIKMSYSHADRLIAGAAVPAAKALSLEAGAEIRAAGFLERRELGIINIGGPGKIVAGGKAYPMAPRDGLYLGKGTKGIAFESLSPAEPAKFYFVSSPAHAALPAARMEFASVAASAMGSVEECNKRTIRKYIHAEGTASCQLVMGLTELEPGSVWNTMPCHTHERRSEIYLYFGLPKDAAVFHMMGRPGETRHIVVRNEEAVISPSWSVHSGCGTRAYSFIWAMAGENQAFADMDPVAWADLA